MKYFIKENIIVIGYVLIVISDIAFEFTRELDLTNTQLNIFKAIGIATAFIAEKIKNKKENV
jgi:hypothetical protein